MTKKFENGGAGWNSATNVLKGRAPGEKVIAVQRGRPHVFTRVTICAAAMATLALSSLAIAQIRPDAGTILDSTRQPAQPVPQAPQKVLPDRTTPQGQPADSERIAVSRFEIEGATLIPVAELQALLADVSGKTVSFGELRAAVERITRRYETAGYFLSRAVLPRQDASSGVIRIRVIEAKYGKVDSKIESPATLGMGLKQSKVRSVLNAQGVTEGAPVTQKQLERALYLLADLPGISSTGELNPGTAVGTTDAQILLRETRPITGQISLDTLGNRYTGRERLSGGIGFNSPLGMGDRLGLNGFVAERSDYVAADYSLPIGNDGLRFGVNGSELHYKLCCSFAALGAKGDVRTAGANLSYPFILSRTQSLVGGIGFERRHAVDDTNAGQTADRVIYATNVNLVWNVSDPWGGINRLSGVFTQGRLDLSGNTGNAAADLGTVQTQGTYTKLRSAYARVQNWDRHQLLFRLQGQWAGKNLDSSEKLSLGGYDGVRAYPQGEAAGDQAGLATLEYAYALPLNVPGRMQVAAFVDTGTVQLYKSTWVGFQGARATLPNNYSLHGAGIGMNWSMPGNFLINLNVATKIGSNPGRFIGGQDADGSSTRTRYWVVLNKTL